MDDNEETKQSKKQKNFKQKKITEFLQEYSDSNLTFNDERIKLYDNNK